MDCTHLELCLEEPHVNRERQAQAGEKTAHVSEEKQDSLAQLLPIGRQEKLQQDLCGHQLPTVSSKGTAAIRAPTLQELRDVSRMRNGWE